MTKLFDMLNNKASDIFHLGENLHNAMPRLLFDFAKCNIDENLKGTAMDWSKIVSEIKATGMTQAQIADEIKIATGSLSELCSGKISDIRWSKGNELLALHAARCGIKAA